MVLVPACAEGWKEEGSFITYLTFSTEVAAAGASLSMNFTCLLVVAEPVPSLFEPPFFLTEGY